METAKGKVFKYGDNVDTDVIIPARYLNVSSGEELAKYCMIDIDADFVNNVKEGDIIVATKNFGCGSSGNQMCRHFLRHCLHLRQNFLPQCHQYRLADSGM